MTDTGTQGEKEFQVISSGHYPHGVQCPETEPWVPEFRGALRRAAGLPDPSAVFPTSYLKKASTG